MKRNGVGSVSEDSVEVPAIMKRHGNLFEKICSIENLSLADCRARLGKKCKAEIQSFDLNRDQLLLKLQLSLINKTFKTSNYHIFKKVVDNGKEREIYRLPYYPDRILHHAIMNVVEPIFYKTFTTDTYSCIKGRGIHSAADKVKLAIRQPDAEYVLKLDVKKFYPSVDHDVLKSIIRRKIKDKDLLWLLDGIIDSAKGLPIGNYLSQSFANLFLSGFDHWVKEIKGVRYYFRYCDDVVIFHQDKAFLHSLLIEITAHLADLKLTVKKDWRVFPSATGVDFIGFVFYPTHTLIRKSIKKRFIKALIRYKSCGSEAHYRSLASYWGWLKYSNSCNLIRKVCS
jgi:retron-type reverse transcriptase